jgi:hypothetical protein
VELGEGVVVVGCGLGCAERVVGWRGWDVGHFEGER